MAKLSQLQAKVMLSLAYDVKGQRLGQALYNTVHSVYPEVANTFWNTNHDFFYWENNAKVMECFLNYWVEQDASM